MAGRYYETVIKGIVPSGLQAFDLTGAIARQRLAAYKRDDGQSLASDWRRVGKAMRTAMIRYRESNTHDVGNLKRV